jgi:hypothetical protein
MMNRIRLFEIRGLILKFDTVTNQSVPMSSSPTSRIDWLAFSKQWIPYFKQEYRVITSLLYKGSRLADIFIVIFFPCEPITGDAGQLSVSQRETFAINQCYTVTDSIVALVTLSSNVLSGNIEFYWKRERIPIICKISNIISNLWSV